MVNLMKINPAFHHFPEEMATVGRIIVSAAELEYHYCLMAGNAINMWLPVLKAMYRLRTTSGRIDASEILLTEPYRKVNLPSDLQEATDALRFCMSMRNTYAHCQWGADTREGLFFSDLEKAAEKRESFEYDWKHTDASLLTAQETYCEHTLTLLSWLKDQFLIRSSQLKDHRVPKPTAMPLPRMHNPKSQHVPPWLSTEYQSRHLERALKSEKSSRSLRRKRTPKKQSAKQKRMSALKKRGSSP